MITVKGCERKIKAVVLITHYNIKLKKQLKEPNVDQKGHQNVQMLLQNEIILLNDKGQLTSKFDKPRDVSKLILRTLFSDAKLY